MIISLAQSVILEEKTEPFASGEEEFILEEITYPDGVKFWEVSCWKDGENRWLLRYSIEELARAEFNRWSAKRP